MYDLRCTNVDHAQCIEGRKGGGREEREEGGRKGHQKAVMENMTVGGSNWLFILPKFG